MEISGKARLLFSQRMLSAFRCFLSARMRIYYNVSLLPGFPSSLKNMFFNTFVNQHFIKMFKRNAKKSPNIFGVYVIKSYFCTRFREREQRCFDILTGAAQELLHISSAWGLFLSGISPLKKQNEKKLPKTFGRYEIKFLPLHPLSKSKQRWLTLFLESGSVNESFLCSSFRDRKSTRLNSSHLKLSRMPSSAWGLFLSEIPL